LEELADMYDSEHRLVKALAKLGETAAGAGLQGVFQQHLGETRRQIERLDEVFAAFGQTPKRKKCEAIVGLLEEGDEIADDTRGEPTLDAALICAAQKVEHYEIASYGCLLEWAGILGNDTAIRLLGETLEEEKMADESLTRLARFGSNENAQTGGPDGENVEATRTDPAASRTASRRSARRSSDTVRA